MSNERHLNINDGTMGNLFRRVTLASLGLDSMEGVSEQSFEVIDKADSFVARLMDAVSHVLPKRDMEGLASKTSTLSEHLIEGMSGLNGPKSATDLKEWQYWLDATLLMLFDEDEDAEESGRSQKTFAQVTPEVVRRSVAALQRSGIKPGMIQAMSPKAKQALSEAVRKSAGLSADRKADEFAHLNADQVAQTISTYLKNASKTDKFASVDRIFAQNSRQLFASHVADKAMAISTQLDASSANNSKVNALRDKWTMAFKALGSQTHFDGKEVREMLTALDGLVSEGAVTREQAEVLRQASSAYARRILVDEISHDTMAVASRLENMVKRSSAHEMSAMQLNSQRAISATASNRQTTDDVFRRSFAALEQHMGDLNKAVSGKVLTDGDSAATVRWSRAADRFARLQGVSDDVDRVLLKDIVESASALENAGIVPHNFIEQVMSMASQADRGLSTSGLASMKSTPVSGIGADRVDFASFGAPRLLGHFADKVEKSVASLVENLAVSGISGISATKVENFVSDIRQIISTGKSFEGKSVAQQTASIIESICTRLDDFAEMAATAVVTSGYEDMGESRGTFVSTSEEAAETPKSSRRKADNMAASLAAVRQVQSALVEEKARAQAQVQALIQQNASMQKQLNAAEQQAISTISAASTLDELIRAQNAVASHLSSENQAELHRMIESVRHSEQHMKAVEKQIRLIEDTAKLSQSLRSAVQQSSGIANMHTVAAGMPSSVVMDDGRIQRDYLTALSGTLSSYAKIRNELAVKAGDFVSAGMTDSKLERMLSIVKPGNMDAVSSSVSSSEDQILRLARNELNVGYDEIIPEMPQMVRSGYPSQSAIKDLSGILGARKATELHMADVVSGRSSSVQALVSSIQKLANAQSERAMSTVEASRILSGRKSQQAMASIREIIARHGGASSIVNAVSASDFSRIEQILAKSEPVFDDVKEIQRIFARSADAVQSDSKEVSRIVSQAKGTLSAEDVAAINTLMERHLLSQNDVETVRQILSKPSVTSDDVRVMEQMVSNASVLRDVVTDIDQVVLSNADMEETSVSGAAAAAAEKVLSSYDAIQSGADASMITSYAMTDEGERVKVSLGIRPEASRAQNFELRRSMGASHIPAGARMEQAQSIAAQVQVSPISEKGLVSGVNEFMPVGVGAISSNALSSDAAEGREVIRGILGRFGVRSLQDASGAEGDRIHMTIGGVDFDMSSSAFVEMVAKPAMSTTSARLPDMMDANSVLFAGYASLLSEAGERRSIKTLRKAYMESLARSGAQSVRSEIGFNTQTFAGMLGGISDAQISRSSFASSERLPRYEADTDQIWLRSGVASSQGGVSESAGSQFAASMLARAESSASSSGFSPDYSWVSNQIRVNASSNANNASDSEHSAQTRKILGRLDNLLDYVEDMSERNVGVFSTDDTVRVLLQSLPQDGVLGNKGLPKWRQKVTQATKMAEARELREALAKIGATPVQGVQRLASKQFVSPNLLTEQPTGSAPLFSGGSDGGSSVSSAPSSDASISDSSSSGKISNEELEALADDIFHRIEESINEEYQRRRSE